jgi:hypothetical protein
MSPSPVPRAIEQADPGGVSWTKRIAGDPPLDHRRPLDLALDRSSASENW